MADFAEMGDELPDSAVAEQSPSADLAPTLFSMGAPFEVVGGSSVVRARRVLQRVWDVPNACWCYFVDSSPNSSPAPAATKPVHSGQLGAHEVLADADPDLDAYALTIDLDALRSQVSDRGLTEAQVQALVASAIAGKADVSALASKADTSALAAKADVSALASKADTSAMTTALADKASIAQLAGKASTSALNEKADKTTVQALDGRVETMETYRALRWNLRVQTAMEGIAANPQDWIIAYAGAAVSLPTSAPNGAMVAVTMLGETGSVPIQWNPARMNGDGYAIAMDEVAGHEATRMFVYVAALNGWINWLSREPEHSYTGGGSA